MNRRYYLVVTSVLIRSDLIKLSLITLYDNLLEILISHVFKKIHESK